eukprot:915983-Rhodomonas_salina.1
MSNTYKTAGAAVLGLIVLTLALVFLHMAEANHDWAVALMQIIICLVGQWIILAYRKRQRRPTSPRLGSISVLIS